MFERRDNGDWLVNIQYNALSSLGLNESINSISVEYFSLQALEEKSFFATDVQLILTMARTYFLLVDHRSA